MNSLNYLKNIALAIKDTVFNFGAYSIPKKSASLAYYTLFAIAPLLFFLISLGSIFFGEEILAGKVFSRLDNFVGSDIAEVMQRLLENTTVSGQSTIATIISFGTLFIIATGVFAEIQDSINQIWNLETTKESGFKLLLKSRIIGFSMILSLGFLMLVTLLVNSVLDMLKTKLEVYLDGFSYFFIFAINATLLVGVISLLFYLIFKLLPYARFSNKVSFTGAILTTLLFLGGKELIDMYLASSNISSVYGTGGTLVLLLSWVYYSSIILFFGAAFTRNLALRGNEQIVSNEGATFVKKKTVEIKDVEVKNEK